MIQNPESILNSTIKDFINLYPESVRTFTTYPGRDALLRHIRVVMHFYDIPGSGHTFTTYPGRTQFNDIPGSPPVMKFSVKLLCKFEA